MHGHACPLRPTREARTVCTREVDVCAKLFILEGDLPVSSSLCWHARVTHAVCTALYLLCDTGALGRLPFQLL